MNPYNPSVIWYASERYARNPLRVVLYQDKGSLTFEDGGLFFRGQRRSVAMRDIEDVRLGRHVPNVLAWLLWSAVFLAIFVVFGWSLIIFGVLLMFVVLGLNPGSLLIKWVRIGYRDENGEPVVVWLTDGSRFGWGGILDGSRLLYEMIHGQVVETNDSGQQADVAAAALAQPENPYAATAHVSASYEGLVLGKTPPPPRQARPETCPWCEACVTPDEDGRCTECNRPIT
jgi:hypothetical protein